MALVKATEYEEIADKLIDKFAIAFGHIELDKVCFLKETEKTPKKYAECRAVRAPYNYLTDFKFFITFYENNMVPLTEAQKIMVVYHELMHIDVDFHKLVPHDSMDFKVLLSKYGVNWDIDPNLPNILDDEEDGPDQVDRSAEDDLDDDDDEDEPGLF